MKNLFTKASIHRHRYEKSIVRNVTGEILEDISAGSSEPLWTNDPIGTGLKNTQQLKVDWSKFEEHVFFNSAEAKVNLAFDEIINQYPFDGTTAEKASFTAGINGYTKYILDQFPKNTGYFNFDGNVYLEIEDTTGKLAPDLAKIIGDAGATKSKHEKGSTIEFWVYVPQASSNTQQIVYQKVEELSDPADPSTKGVSIFRSAINASTNKYKLTYLISSDRYKSIAHTTIELDCDTWYHVAFVYKRADTERVMSYVNGVYSSKTVNNQAELDDIRLGNVKIKLGLGRKHTTYDPNAEAATLHSNIPTKFVGLLDEFRSWATVRTEKQIKDNHHKNVNASTDLGLYYRCNEPNFTDNSYDAKLVVLDFSGNSLHTIVKGIVGSFDPKKKINNSSGNLILTPMLNELDDENPVLFPDYPLVATMSANYIKEANNYDRNNPNLITKLVPHHYFEEAKFFEGIATDLETPLSMDVKGTEYPLPGHAKVPPRVIMFSFLMVWANFFDEIKLWLDSFSLLNKVTYETFDQIPLQVINFLGDYYGIELPNPYSTENPARFKKGQNIGITRDKQSSLQSTLENLWRRILINMPFLIRSRGTIQGIKALMNTIGIEADTVFNFREYGGSITKSISSSRVKRKKQSGFIDMSKGTRLKSSPIWGWRHEPGLPDAGGAPAIGEILFQSGDITIATNDGPPKPTSFLSGSWAYEGRYRLLETETTASLFRIERDDDVLINLVAMRADDGAGVDYNLKLFIDGHQTSTNPQTLTLPGVNLWDRNPWYISINNKYGSSENSIEVRCIKTSDVYVIEHHSGSLSYTKSAVAPSTVGGVTTYNTGIPMFQVEDTTTTSQNTLRWYIGPSITSLSTDYNNVTNGRITNYSGKISHMRFWTKNLTKPEQIEHAQNPFSVSVENPITSNSFPNTPIVTLNGAGTAYVETPLGKYSGRYSGTLPVNSWERIRQSFDMLQASPTFTTGSFELIDTTQNLDNVQAFGNAGMYYRDDFIYTIVAPDFDSNSTSNKIRVRSYLDEDTAKENNAYHGNLTELPLETGIDDRRFAIESSLVGALNEDMINVLGNVNILNNFLGAPELEYAVEYPELKKLEDLYFNRVEGRVNYNVMIEFQRWFNNNFASLVEQFIPHTADFLGINFVIESHLFERHKMEYKQGDVHVDIRDRQAFSQEPLFLGTIRAEIT